MSIGKIERNAYRRAKHAEILERRRRVMTMYCDGKTQAFIANELGVSQQRVSEDIAASIQHWRRQYGIDINALIVQEVEKLNRLEAKANAAYELSCEKKKIATIATGTNGVTSTATLIERKEGDMTCLAMVERCIARRIRLLQLDKRRVEDEAGGEQAMTFVDFMTQWYRSKEQRVVEAPRLVRTGNS